MDNFKAILQDKLREPRNLAIAAGIVGLLIGLFFAYVLFPIKWTDASAEHLRPICGSNICEMPSQSTRLQVIVRKPKWLLLN